MQSASYLDHLDGVEDLRDDVRACVGFGHHLALRLADSLADEAVERNREQQQPKAHSSSKPELTAHPDEDKKDERGREPDVMCE